MVRRAAVRVGGGLRAQTKVELRQDRDIDDHQYLWASNLEEHERSTRSTDGMLLLRVRTMAIFKSRPSR